MKGLCLALGVLSVLMGAALYFNEQNDTSLFHDQDYTMAYVAFGVGAFLLLLGAILSSGATSTSTLGKIEARPTEAGWHPDPLGRFDSRFWDGERWTQHVGRVEGDGTKRQLEDPV